MDDIIQRQFPTVLAPRFSELEPMTESGERFVLAGDRLAFEVSRPWLHAVCTISETFKRPTPYGAGLPDGVTLRCGPIPKTLLDQFLDQALTAYPCETAAWIVWSEEHREFVYILLRIVSASNDHVEFERPLLQAGMHLVMDIHSHGAFPAFFSTQDDKDDKDQLCISAVVGKVNDPKPVIIARLSMLGVFYPLGEI